VSGRTSSRLSRKLSRSIICGKFELIGGTMFKKILTGSIAATALTVSAYAADLPMRLRRRRRLRSSPGQALMSA